MKRIMFLLFICLNFQAFSEPVQTLFDQANAAYKVQDYQQAADLYQKMIDDNHVKSAVIYYNLGCSYYKQNMVGKSVLYFEKAQLLAPRDSEIKENLLIVREKLIDKINIEGSFLQHMLDAALSRLSLSEVAWLFWFVFIIFAVAFVMFVNFRNRPKAATFFYIALPVFLLVTVIFTYKYISYNEIIYGIIVTEKVEVKSGPGEDFKTLFVVHEGARARVVRVQAAGWKRIELANGFNGWVPKDDLGIINPL